MRAPSASVDFERAWLAHRPAQPQVTTATGVVTYASPALRAWRSTRALVAPRFAGNRNLARPALGLLETPREIGRAKPGCLLRARASSLPRRNHR
jgi:hypothetical protein